MKSSGSDYVNFGPRLTLAFAVLITLILGGNSLVIWQFHLARIQTDRLSGANQQLIAVLHLQLSLLSFHQRLDELVRSGDAHRLTTEAEPLRRLLREQARQTRAAVANLSPETRVDPAFLPTLETIEVTLPAQLDAINELAQSGDWGTVQRRLGNELKPIEIQTSILVDSVDQQARDELTEAAAKMGSVQNSILIIVPATAISTFCIAAFLSWSVSRRMHQLRIEQLRRQERKLRDVVETIPTFAWTALPDGAVDFVNHHWVEYTGLSTEKTMGSGWESAVHPADLPPYVQTRGASVTSGEPFEHEVRFRCAADGEYRWFLSRSVPLRDSGGKIVKWYGISTDIEDRKRAENERERLRQLEADLAHVNRVSTLGEMAASLAHEIKQPIAATITSANSCIEWLAHEPPNLDRARAAAARIDKYGNRAAEIIDRIRSLYKKSPPQRELVDINGIIQEMLTLLKCEADRYSVAMRAELAAELPKIMADPVQLQQVFMNLMLNGIQAMTDSGGELAVKSELEDGQLQFSVSDTGVGLPREKMDQIFSAFFTTKPQGSGMGLAISRSIVESHGGRLWATANSGGGATFHFTLPIQVTESSPLVA